MITSAIRSSSSKRWIIENTWSLVRFASSLMPEPPDINPIFSGPYVIISSMLFPRYIKSARLYLGRIPSMISMLARPKSASKTTTRLPRRPSWIAKFTERLVFPTPPLPLVTVITLATRSWSVLESRFLIMFLNCSAWSTTTYLLTVFLRSSVHLPFRYLPAHSVPM